MVDELEPSGPFDRIDPADEAAAGASAFLDGEGPAPVAPSPEVERFRDDALRLRALVSARPAPVPPDLTGAIVGRLPPGRPPTRRWQTLAAVAASFVIGLAVSAAFLLDDDFSTEPLAASDFEADIRGSSIAVSSLDAAVTVQEYGAHPDVASRSYEGRLHYRSPEQLSLTLTETTPLPAGWLPNDVTVIVDDDVAWRTRRLACPVDSMPACLSAPAVTGIEGRAPFSAGWAAPLDLVVPVDATRRASIARTDESVVTAVTTVGRAASLISATIDNGAFRQVHADDTIEIRVDAEALTLRGLTIRASGSPARTVWATTWGYTDEPGTEILRLEIDEDDEVGSLPPLPDTVHFSDGGFVDGPVSIDGLAAAMPAGFTHHRSGVLRVPGGPDTEISGWADGRAWITVRVGADAPAASAAATLRTFERGVVVVDDALHEAVIHTGDHRIVVGGTLPLDDLVALASRLPYTGLAPSATSDDTHPPIRVGDATVRVEVRTGSLLPPADRGDIVGVALRGTTGRFSPTLGELTWVERNSIVVLSGTDDLDELLAAAAQVTVP